MKNFRNSVLRFLLGLRRPSGSANRRLLHKNGETLSAFIIREATITDIDALVTLHIQTWYETYWNSRHRLSRDYVHKHWNDFFESANLSAFCLVIENTINHQLVGFARGKPYSSEDLPDYEGELNKIFILKQYQRLGLGKKLIAEVVKRFIDKGINSMVLFGIPQNPSCGFHEAVGGKRLYGAKRKFNGGYGWENLREWAEKERLIL